MNKIFQKNLVIIAVLFSVVLLAYWNLPRTFYQQDEWQTLGTYLINGWGIAAKDVSILQVFFAEGRILTRIFYFIFIGLFPYNVTPIFLFAILFHALNAWLVYCIVEKLKGSKIACWAAALFFSINSVSDQTVLWVSAICTIPATTLMLVSIFWYIDFLDHGNIRKRNFAFIVGILSLFFKETGLFILVLYPVMYAFWREKKSFKDIVFAHRPIIIYGALVIIFRLAEILLAPKAAAGFISHGSGFIFPLIYHTIAYPLISFFQIFLPSADMYSFVSKVTQSEYSYLIGSPLFTLVAQSSVGDVLSLIGTLILSGFLGIIVFLDIKKTKQNNLLLLGVLIVFFSFMPYAVLNKVFTYMSSRYYYVGVVGGAFVFGYVASWIFKRLHLIGRIILTVGIALFFYHHVLAIQYDVNQQISIAQERKKFILEIKRVHPSLAKKTVFYITSDRPYLGEIRYPFQNGLGYILEVLYYKTGNIPRDFIESNFLWDLGAEGYKKSDVYGFGYFQNLDNLGEFVTKGAITPEIVFGYVYNSKTRSMMDITDATRLQLATLSAILK